MGGPGLLTIPGPLPLSLIARRTAAGGAGTGPPTLRTTILPPQGGSLGLPTQTGRLLGPLPGRISVVSVLSMRSEQGPLGLDTSTFCLRIVTSESGWNPVPIGGS